MKKLFAITPFVLLAACGAALTPQSAPRGPTVPPMASDTCNANEYASLIGQDATALERVMILSQVRVIRPGQAVTMDFRPERINFNIDQGNRITSISCN